MLFLIVFLVFVSAVLIASFGVPYVLKSAVEVNARRAQDFGREVDRTMLDEDIQAVQKFYIAGPFVCALAGAFLVPGGFGLKAGGLLAGAAVGWIIPKTYASILQNKRRGEFENQLIDALMIMSSSFRGGLSLVQAIEAVVEEMGQPIRQEFGFVLGENKMGVSLEESLARLYKRMPSASLQQMISAILLSRETGGNLPAVFTRIVSTLRERKKIEENLKVLTLQGRLQAIVMSGLPVVFFFMVNTTNKDYFRVMTSSDTGRMLLMVCVVLWLIGTFFIIKISAVKDF
jgi:tight adherence protein B